MSSILNAPVIWFIIGFIFFLLEFTVPGFILFFFGLGAWIVACTCLLADIPINIQIFLFIGASLLAVLLFRNWTRKKLGMKKADRQVLEDEIKGKKAIADTDILPGKQGKVLFKGTTWSAISDDVIKKGQDVIIVGNESITLIVKSSI